MSAIPYAMRTRRRGMTLPELVVATAIVGLLTSFAVPSVRRSLRRHSLEEATQKLRASLVEAQTLAIKKNAAVTVRRVGTTGYRIDGKDTQTLPTSVSFVSTSADSVRFVSFGPPTTGAASFTLQWDASHQSTVSVNAAGRVTR